jgi:hypothetical protein
VEGVTIVSIRKTGSGQVTGTEGPVTKTATVEEPWTPKDDEELAEENREADGGHE